MKTNKIFAIAMVMMMFLTIISLSSLRAQPTAFSYQAAVRNTSGEPILNTLVSFRISILSGSSVSSATSVYSERHVSNTGDYGIVSLSIGKGVVLSGDMSTINWTYGNKYLKVEMDVNNGTSYVDMGTTQLLSVPFALIANEANTAKSVNYSNIINKPVFSKVATSGSYKDLIDTPVVVKPKYKIGQQIGDDIVFWVSSDGQHCLVVTKMDISSMQLIKYDTLVLTFNGVDGSINTNIMKNSRCKGDAINYIIANYPTYYIPSMTEWQLILEASVEIGNLINLNLSNTVVYATSTRQSDFSPTKIMAMYGGFFSYYPITNTFYYRLVKKY